MRKSLLLFFVFVSALAWGSPVPTFNITQGSATVTADPQGLVAGLVSFQFSGNGFSIVGTGSIACNFCVNSAPSGLGPLDAGMTIFADPFNTGGAAIFLGNGVQYQSALFSGLSFTSGTSFSLPSGSQSTFSIVLPVTLSGSVVAYGNCDFTILSCPTPIGTFSVNSKGTATINYTNQDGAWFFSSAAFTLSPVPEPGTMSLLGTGLAALGGLIRRKRR